MKKVTLLAFAALITAGSHAQDKITHPAKIAGIVYHDANGNGKRDKRESGIAKVAVSNGRDVVLTDAKGRYELPVGSDNGIL